MAFKLIYSDSYSMVGIGVPIYGSQNKQLSERAPMKEQRKILLWNAVGGSVFAWSHLASRKVIGTRTSDETGIPAVVEG